MSLANRGRSLESALAVHHEAYALTGRAFVLRTSAPMRILRRLPKGGQFVAVFEAVGMPDYFAVSGGRLFVFDAKEHAGHSFPFAALPVHQAEAFDAATKQGATAGLVVRLPEVNAAWWIRWSALGARWWKWHRLTTRAPAGSASLDVNGLDACGFRLTGLDWLPKLS